MAWKHWETVIIICDAPRLSHFLKAIWNMGAHSSAPKKLPGTSPDSWGTLGHHNLQVREVPSLPGASRIPTDFRGRWGTASRTPHLALVPRFAEINSGNNMQKLQTCWFLNSNLSSPFTHEKHLQIGAIWGLWSAPQPVQPPCLDCRVRASIANNQLWGYNLI